MMRVEAALQSYKDERVLWNDARASRVFAEVEARTSRSWSGALSRPAALFAAALAFGALMIFGVHSFSGPQSAFSTANAAGQDMAQETWAHAGDGGSMTD